MQMGRMDKQGLVTAHSGDVADFLQRNYMLNPLKGKAGLSFCEGSIAPMNKLYSALESSFLGFFLFRGSKSGTCISK